MSQEQNLSEFNRFLINNHSFLQEKYREYFANHIPFNLANLHHQTMVDYINDIFSFQKYQSETAIHQKIISSLNKNLNDFISKNQTKMLEEFTCNMAIQILTFCIQNNDLFSVQYDIRENKEEKISARQIKGNINIHMHIEEGYEANISQSTNNKLENIKNKQLQEEIISNFPLNSLSSIHKVSKPSINQLPISHSKLDGTLKKNMKIVFDLYCKNQMQLGGNKTFERLNEEASTMTIGKLLVYAKAYNMMSTIINKDILMQKFKKISEGRRAINFQQFYALLIQLHSLDTSLFERLQLYEDSLVKNVKFVKFPFYTQDQSPRELVGQRNFINKLTAHSGKTHVQLKEDINLKRINSLENNVGLHSKIMPVSGSRNSFLRPKDLLGIGSRDYSIDLSFIDKIVSPEVNDQKWLSEYEIQHRYDRKRQQMERYNIQDRNPSFDGNLKQKGSIVDNIRKRISEIENMERRKIPIGAKNSHLF